MPDAVHIGGSEKIRLVAKALRHLGTDRTILNEAAKNIRKAAPSIRDAIRASAKSNLPKRGGLNVWVSKASIRVRVLRTGRRAGISLVVGRNSAHGRTDIKRIDAGVTRHPLWGNRKHWYAQSVTPGFATNVIRTGGADQLRAASEAALDTAIKQVLDVL